MTFDLAHRRELTALARQSVTSGLEYHRPLKVKFEVVSAKLGQPGASFVTLKRTGQLRGCIGTLIANQALAQDVATNAYSAAFRDPRFDPLGGDELEGLLISISVLSTPQPMVFSNEADLLAQLQPGIDGLILKEGNRRGTFLPSVWESLPSPQEFWPRLKMKAGLDPDYWSDSLLVERYTTESW